MKTMTLQEVASLLGCTGSSAICSGKCPHNRKRNIKTAVVSGKVHLVDCAALSDASPASCLHLFQAMRGCPFVGEDLVVSVIVTGEEDRYVLGMSS